MRPCAAMHAPARLRPAACLPACLHHSHPLFLQAPSMVAAGSTAPSVDPFASSDPFALQPITGYVHTLVHLPHRGTPPARQLPTYCASADRQRSRLLVCPSPPAGSRAQPSPPSTWTIFLAQLPQTRHCQGRATHWTTTFSAWGLSSLLRPRLRVGTLQQLLWGLPVALLPLLQRGPHLIRQPQRCQQGQQQRQAPKVRPARTAGPVGHAYPHLTWPHGSIPFACMMHATHRP